MADEIKPAEGSIEAKAETPPVAATGDVDQVKPDASGNKPDTGSAESETAPAQQELLAGLDLSKFSDEARDIARTWAQKREDDRLRYITSKAQTYADAEKKAQAYDDFVATELEGYKAWKSAQATPASHQPAASADPAANPALVQSYVNSGYSPEEASQMAMSVTQTVRQELAAEKKQLNVTLSQQNQNYQKLQARQTLDDLASQYPDVRVGIKDGTFIPFVQHYCGVEKQPLEVAYQKWDELRNAGAKQARQKEQDRIREKKDASSVTRTPASNSEIVYVNNMKDFNRVAAQEALSGKKRQVRLKKK